MPANTTKYKIIIVLNGTTEELTDDFKTFDDAVAKMEEMIAQYDQGVVGGSSIVEVDNADAKKP